MDKKFWVLYVCLIIMAITGAVLLRGTSAVSDEQIHFDQISMLLHGDWSIHRALTVFPGYHAVIASVLFVFNLHDFLDARLITSIILMLSLVPIFYFLSKSIRKTLQLVFFPLMFAFYFLIYTDLLSVVFVGLGLLLLFYKRYNWAATIFILSMFVRQNNFMWLAFGGLYVLWELFELYKPIFVFDKTFWLKVFHSTWMYIVGVILFGLFIIVNKGLVIGDRVSHPAGFHSTNIYYIFFMMFFLFLPAILFRLKDMWRWIVKHKVLTIIIVVGSILLCIFNFHNSHWYNNTEYEGSITGTGMLRNVILHWADVAVLNKVLFMIPILISLFYVITTKFKRPLYYLLYPISFIFLGGSQLVDPRYYFIPFAFFLIFKVNDSDKDEWYLTAYFILLALLMFVGIYRHSMMW